MKKIILGVLLLAVAATTSAFAHTLPRWGVPFACWYDNYSGPALDPGASTWVLRSSLPAQNIYYTYEYFSVSWGTENYKATWAKPSTDSYGRTTWEFTFYNGPQCKTTVVQPGGRVISFSNCTDGHTRWCYTEY